MWHEYKGRMALGDEHGDFILDEETGWAAQEGRSDDDFKREILRKRKRDYRRKVDHGTGDSEPDIGGD